LPVPVERPARPAADGLDTLPFSTPPEILFLIPEPCRMLPTMLTDPAPACDHPQLQAELDFLLGRINYERRAGHYPRHFKLESMRNLLAELGNPQSDYSIIHVAGTKGKGSVCRMIAGALNAAGILTGVYSSPHIESIRERISLGGQLISESQLAEVLNITRRAVLRLDGQAERDGLRKNSFFEIITAAAFLHFRRQRARQVVLEVGLGGRLDSTNVCQPDLCVITNISLDHVRQLGPTVDRIAREKAGIIKPGVPVVSGVLDPLAAREIRESCSVCNSDLMELNQDFHYRILGIDDQLAQIRLDTWGVLPERHSYHLKNLVLNSCGEHQAGNAAIAAAAVNLLPHRFDVPASAIRQTLAGFSMIGRSEILSRDPLIIVDMAHNVASVQALVATLQRLRPHPQPGVTRRLIFGSSRDKDLAGMLVRLLPLFDQVIFTRFVENPRATDPPDLLRIARQTGLPEEAMPGMVTAPEPRQAWEQVCGELRPGDLLCVAGSAFLVAELRPLIRNSAAHT
jgi:dihydrofolate synthase/folylpolyglutamate synthase